MRDAICRWSRLRSPIGTLLCVGLLASIGGCGGGGNGTGGNFYSCDNVKTSTASNGDVTLTHFCEEFTLHVDPAILANAVDVLKQSCDETLTRFKVATFSSKPCSTDPSLFATCVAPTSSDSDMGKEYDYFDELNGVVLVTPVVVEAGCTQIRD